MFFRIILSNFVTHELPLYTTEIDKIVPVVQLNQAIKRNMIVVS